MKRKTTVLLAGIMVLALVGCGEKDASVEAGQSIESATESQIEPVTESPVESVTEKPVESSTEDPEEVNIDDESDILYADLLPVTSDYFESGEITIIDPDGGSAYAFRVTNYQEGEYEAYTEACKNIGFDDVTYEGENDGGKMFYAYSGDGKYYLQVMLGYQIEAIDISCKESTKDRTSSNSTSEENETSVEVTDNSEISSEFKEAMDSYEKFFDEYCEFMKKYANSDDQTSMLTDYTDYMAQYTETMEKMEAINQDELSTAEVAYYAEVSARISQKLLEVTQ